MHNMPTSLTISNETLAAEAFSAQSGVFDDLYRNNTIVHYKRNRIRAHVNSLLQPGSQLLELNAGTGEDSLYFASRGHHVHATDIAPGMLQQLQHKVQMAGLTEHISTELRSYTALDQLHEQGPFDHVFSNFAGLNCTDQLGHVLQSLSPLVKKGGTVTLVLLPSFCLWESALLFKGMWRTAFRRFAGKKGARSHVEGHYFRCWYYQPSFVKQIMREDFEHLCTEGLCTLVPPSYIEHFAEKYPRVYSMLCRLEESHARRWPWRNIGDYYIISFRKK